MRFTRHVIYGLKKVYGKPVIIQRQLSLSMDVETGIQDIQTTTIRVSRASVLPANELLYRFSKLAERGVVELSTLAVLLDRKDLGDLELNTQDSLIISNVRYTIQNITIEDNMFVLLVNKVTSQVEVSL